MTESKLVPEITGLKKPASNKKNAVRYTYLALVIAFELSLFNIGRKESHQINF